MKFLMLNFAPTSQNRIMHVIALLIYIYIYIFITRNLTKAGSSDTPLGSKPLKHDPTCQNCVSGNPQKASSRD